ncbi:Histone acetyltransferase [Hondaea fermentalgiana]|uniref:Histone acetyltransferase n=1 Tax=Hondaea fermentalgiana TaxID=2315210 RepID=A0A2R5GBP0_9STRA|nr:Histone acetyltransferase [Hondaea fermentalgiana]|eukprot:GBG28400.1 Histone acetyltransferase [Hondaea fermentalgiana]
MGTARRARPLRATARSKRAFDATQDLKKKTAGSRDAGLGNAQARVEARRLRGRGIKLVVFPGEEEEEEEVDEDQSENLFENESSGNGDEGQDQSEADSAKEKAPDTAPVSRKPPHSDAASETQERLIDKVQLGDFDLDVWFFSPYPAKLCAETDKLFICQQCFKYFGSGHSLSRHRAKCPLTQPPGTLVYKDHESRSMYVVEGRRNREYCRNLCLFCKLFLDQKTLFYDVDMFYFFVMVVDGAVVGYFSREATTNKGLNLSCILTFPQYQSCGYGKFLISVSYAISVLEGRVGSPEKPLSDFGLAAYRSYWRAALLDFILARMQAVPASAIAPVRSARKPRAARPTSFAGLEDGDPVDDAESRGVDNDEDDGGDDEEDNGADEVEDDEEDDEGKAQNKASDDDDDAARFEEATSVIALGGSLWIDMKTLAKETGISAADIRDTFQHNNMLLRHDSQIILYIRRELLAKHLRAQPGRFFCTPTLLRRDLLPKFESRR